MIFLSFYAMRLSLAEKFVTDANR